MFVLSSNVTASLGVWAAILAFIAGGATTAVLGSCSANVGARTRMTLALLAELSFGRRGANVVQLAIALALIGWFAVIVSVLGATASSTIGQVYGVQIPTPVIAIPLCALIAVIAHRGINSLERLGAVIVPLTFLLLAVAVTRTLPRFLESSGSHGTGALSFGGSVSAVIGAYIVGIIIQPDYGRFIRRPRSAAVAVLASMGVVYPMILSLSAIPSVSLGRPDLIASLIALGIGMPALALLLLGAWIDASACLYSGSLALAKLLPRVRYAHIVFSAGLICTALVFAHVESQFIPFLQILGLALPPIASVQCVTAIAASRQAGAARGGELRSVDLLAFLAWGTGTAMGTAAHLGFGSLTGIPALDAIFGAAAATLFVVRWRSRAVLAPVALDREG